MREISSVDWTDCSSCWILGCVILWFFTTHFTVDPVNVNTYGLDRQVLSLWKVCFNEFISSFKLHLPRKKSHWCWDSSSTGNMVKELFLFIFVLLILQETSMSLLVPFCDVHCCGVFLQYFFHLQNLNVEFLLIFNHSCWQEAKVCWVTFSDVQVTSVETGRKKTP